MNDNKKQMMALDEAVRGMVVDASKWKITEYDMVCYDYIAEVYGQLESYHDHGAEVTLSRRSAEGELDSFKNYVRAKILDTVDEMHVRGLIKDIAQDAYNQFHPDGDADRDRFTMGEIDSQVMDDLIQTHKRLRSISNFVRADNKGRRKADYLAGFLGIDQWEE